MGVVGFRTRQLGLRRFGLPVGGPWDPPTADLVSLHSGSPDVLEIANGQAVIRCDEDCTLYAIGSGIQIDDSRPKDNVRQRIRSNVATSIRAKLGYVAVAKRVTSDQNLAHFERSSISSVRFVPLTERQPITNLTVSPSSNRMGIRFDGLRPTEVMENPSEPVAPGSIQQTASGQLIIIGPDGPTIGGYPRIGYVIEADLPRLGYLEPGATVDLIPVTLELAIAEIQNSNKEFLRLKRLVEVLEFAD